MGSHRTLTGQLLDIYERLMAAYGPQHWWPGDTSFEIMVGAILTQASAWTNAQKGISNLADAGALSPGAIRRLGDRELATLIFPSGLFNSKARKLKALAEYLGRRFDDDIDAMAAPDTATLRGELLAVYGIGEETADDILLYAVGKPTFVVDSYARRFFHRLGLAPEKGRYATYRALFMDHLPVDRELYGEYHGLIVRHAKEACRKTPVCGRCPLIDVCPTGRTQTPPPA
jgi:endonuclease-3 related protein